MMENCDIVNDWKMRASLAIATAVFCACLAPAGFAAQTGAQSSAPAQGESSSKDGPPLNASSPAASTPAQSVQKPAAAPEGGAPEDPSSATAEGTVIEEVVARVNDDIITRSDLDRARTDMQQEVQQDCSGCTPDQIQAEITQKEPDLLRNLIDQSLLVQRAKDDDINVDADVVKQLDQIRQENHLDSLEELETKIDSSGMDFQDYKTNIQNHLLQEEVIRKEVAPTIIVDHAEVVKYYNDHQDEFQRPEQVVLREIFVSTDKKAPEEIPALQKKAQGLLDRVRAGDDFGQLAVHFSDGSTAKDGGELGTFERGQLAPEIEGQVFKLDRNGTTDVIETKTGYLIIQVEQRYEAGQQPIEKVEDDIMDKLYQQKMAPALRDYLKKLREDSFVEIKPGYVDSAAVPTTQIQEVSATPDTKVKTKTAHRFLIFGHKKYPTQGT